MVKEVRPDDPRILSPTFSIGIEVLGADSGDDTESSEDIFYTPPLTQQHCEFAEFSDDDDLFTSTQVMNLTKQTRSLLLLYRFVILYGVC
jgi:hypothetical protein